MFDPYVEGLRASTFSSITSVKDYDTDFTECQMSFAKLYF